ncbi:potassium channel family protein [Microbacterium sp. GXF7504]
MDAAAADHRGDNARTRRWSRASYWPLTVAALLFIVVRTAQVLGDLQGYPRVVTLTLTLVLWLVFIVDYLARFLLAGRARWVWWRHHLFDLAVMLTPALRPVRLLDAATRIRIFNRTAGNMLRARLLIYGIGASLLLIWDISLAVLENERHAPGANITTFGDAVWWAFCTVTTVGYGDYTPVTFQGRVLAVLLMLGGVVLVGLVVATFSSWVTDRVARGHDDQMPATRADITALRKLLDPDARVGGGGGDTAPEPRHD